MDGENTFELELDGLVYAFSLDKLDMVKDWLDANADDVRG